MRKLKFLLCILIGFVVSCNPHELPADDPSDNSNPAFGTVEFDFAMPDLNLPDKNIHRVDLSLAKTYDSLYRKEFCSAANTSDYKQKYSFTLLPGRYYYQAGITCTCQADSCLYAGFPGRQMSTWWTTGWVDVEKGKVYEKKILFK